MTFDAHTPADAVASRLTVRHSSFPTERGRHTRNAANLLLFIAGLSLALGVLWALTLEQVGTFLHLDNLTFGLPTRVLISRSFSAGVEPLWNFWSQAGTPLSTIFAPIAESPIVRIISFFGVYRELSFTAEVVAVFCLGFAGFYLWTRDFTRPWVALVGAYAYTLAPCNVVLMPVNLENVVSAFMYPWLLLGLRRLFACQPIGVVFVAVSVWISCTTGYLGINVIVYQFILLYALGEWLCLSSNGRDRLHTRLRTLTRTIPLFVLTALLTTALLSFPLFETGTLFHFDFSGIRTNDFTPLESTTSLASLVTLFFPNSISTFGAETYNGQIVSLFTGLTTLFFAIFSFTVKRHYLLKVWLLFVAALCFSSTLSQHHWISRILVDLIPFYKQVRYHCWNVNFTLLLIVGLGCMGMEDFLRRGPSAVRGARVAFLVLLLAAAAAEVFLRLDGHTELASIAPLFMRWHIYPFLFLVAALLTIKSLYTHPSLVAFLIAATVVAEPILIGHQYVHLTEQREAIWKASRYATAGFLVPPSGNERTHMTWNNSQYFTQQLAFRDRNPLIMPSVKAILDRGQEYEYLGKVFYPLSASARASVTNSFVQITAINPTAMKATITTSVPQQVVWSVPFTPHWNLTLNGQRHDLHSTPEGLGVFSVEAGVTTVELTYSPYYLRLSRWLRALAVVVLILLVARETRRWVSSVPRDPATWPPGVRSTQ